MRNPEYGFEDDVIDRLARIEEISTGAKAVSDDHEHRVRSLERRQTFLYALLPVALIPLLAKLGLHIPLPPFPM